MSTAGPNTAKAARPTLPFQVEGGCHCGAVRYRATVRRYRVSECNCSMCTKKGYLHVVVAAPDFELLQGRDALSSYRFNTGVADHLFCKHCGIHSFYVPRSHPDGFSLNARCLDGDAISWLDRETFDGQNWEANIHALREADVQD